jgi:uncharacterized membrane protein YhaH (DUF805 family)
MKKEATMFSFQEAVVSFFRKYFQFSGRATRSEYWWPQLLNFVVGLMIGFAGVFAAGATGMHNALFIDSMTTLWNLAIVVPLLALAVRRLHDVGFSGWWLLGPIATGFFAVIVLVPALTLGSMAAVDEGALILSGLLVLACLGFSVFIFVCSVLPSQPGENRFGQPSEPPHAVHESFVHA